MKITIPGVIEGLQFVVSLLQEFQLATHSTQPTSSPASAPSEEQSQPSTK